MTNVATYLHGEVPIKTTFTSREFNQDTAGAKRAAKEGPVFVTDRGEPTHVLMTYRDYEALAPRKSLLEILSYPPGIEDIDFDFPRVDEMPRPAEFD